MNLLIVGSITLSLVLNVALLWYSIRLLKKLYYISDHTDLLLSINTHFAEHLKSLYELEMYYGEPTLEALLKHAQHVVEEVEEFNSIFSGVDILAEIDADENTNEIEEEEELYAEENKKESR